jgi:fluoride exporter
VRLLAVVLGAMVGAPARYLTDLVVQSRHGSELPWGTVTVNVAGSLVLGVTAGALTGGGGDHWLLLLVGTGFCGALTTYSTFGYETLRLTEERAGFEAVANVVASLAAGLGAAALGWAVGAAVT